MVLDLIVVEKENFVCVSLVNATMCLNEIE